MPINIRTNNWMRKFDRLTQGDDLMDFASNAIPFDVLQLGQQSKGWIHWTTCLSSTAVFIGTFNIFDLKWSLCPYLEAAYVHPR